MSIAMGIVALTWNVEFGAGASTMIMPSPKYWPFEYVSALAAKAMNKTAINFIGFRFKY
jgi:hypothetical protein